MKKTFEQKLNKLRGKSPDKIAEYLFKKGIKGFMLSSCGCPIASWVRKETGAEFVSVSVGVIGGIHYTTGTGDDIHLSTPPNIAQFIENFDLGFYPKLCKPREF